jgi:hypothetical protein
VIREEADYFIVGNGLQNGDNLVLTIPEYPQKDMEVLIAGQKDIKAKDKSDEISVEPTSSEKE